MSVSSRLFTPTEISPRSLLTSFLQVMKTAFSIKHALGVSGKPVSSKSLLQRADRHATTEDARTEDAGTAAAALVSMAGGR
jgi:hypothetical protein